MPSYLVSFGHGYSKSGAYDTGCASGNFVEQEMVRRLRPHIRKWADVAGIDLSFYDNNMYADRNVGNYKGYIIVEVHLDAPAGVGGHVIIADGSSPDNIDVAFANLIKKWFGIVGYVGADGINERSDLLNLNVCASNGTNYRLIELFFLSNVEDRETYVNNLDAIGKEFVESLIGYTIAGKVVSAEPVNIVTNYKMEVGYVGYTIDSKPWGVKGSEYWGRTDDYIGHVVTIVEESPNREYANTDLGWIDKRALIAPEPERILISYEASLIAAGYSIDTKPWGENGFNTVDLSDKYIGHKLMVDAETVSGEYARISKNGERLGWIDKRAIKKTPEVVSSKLFLPNGKNWVIYPENGPYEVGRVISVEGKKKGGTEYTIKGDKGSNILVIDLQGEGIVGIYYDIDKGATLEREYA